MSEKKLVKFVGGPLDGQSREIDAEDTVYNFKEHPDSEDVTQAEIPPGYIPSVWEVTYEESPKGSGTFVLQE